MTADELKSIPKGNFVVMKTGTHPMQTRLRLFLEWGISFDKPYILPERAARKVACADRTSLISSIKAQNVVVSDAPVQADIRPERYIHNNRRYNTGAGGGEKV